MLICLLISVHECACMFVCFVCDEWCQCIPCMYFMYVLSYNLPSNKDNDYLIIKLVVSFCYMLNHSQQYSLGDHHHILSCLLFSWILTWNDSNTSDMCGSNEISLLKIILSPEDITKISSWEVELISSYFKASTY